MHQSNLPHILKDLNLECRLTIKEPPLPSMLRVQVHTANLQTSLRHKVTKLTQTLHHPPSLFNHLMAGQLSPREMPLLEHILLSLVYTSSHRNKWIPCMDLRHLRSHRVTHSNLIGVVLQGNLRQGSLLMARLDSSLRMGRRASLLMVSNHQWIIMVLEVLVQALLMIFQLEEATLSGAHLQIME